MGLGGAVRPATAKPAAASTLALASADIAAAKAIREVVPEARMVHIDPLIRVVAPQRPARPGRGGAARDL